ncbi:MAG: PilZ domain-containing protein [Terriglobales bacterium]
MQTVANHEPSPENLPDRRRHLRYRYSAPITIRSTECASIPGITIEISECGMSAITAHTLKIDEIVELHPVAGRAVSALVRRRVGRVYGFEFLHLTAKQTRKIRESCKSLARYPGNSLGI